MQADAAGSAMVDRTQNQATITENSDSTLSRIPLRTYLRVGHCALSRNQDGNVSASVPTNPTWTLTPLKAEWLRQIAGRLLVRIENDVVDDKAIALVLYDR